MKKTIFFSLLFILSLLVISLILASKPSIAASILQEATPIRNSGEVNGRGQLMENKPGEGNLHSPLTSGDYILHLPRLGSQSSPTVFAIEDSYYQAGSIMDAAVESGSSWFRKNSLRWADVEPQKGQRQWSQVSALEVELKNLGSTGKEIVLIIHITPQWARQYPNSGCGPIKQSEIPAFANFVADAVTRYSAPPFNIHYYEIWNEPDAYLVDDDTVFGCWGDKNDTYYGGRYYGQVLKQVYPKLKAADPYAKLVLGGLLLDCDPVNPPIDPGTGKPKDCKNSRYLEGILVEGGGPYFDIISYHAYDYYYGALGVYGNTNWNAAWDGSGPSLIAKTRFLKDTLAKYNVTGKTLLNTEVALLCQSNCDATFQQTKAYYVAQAYAATIAEGIKGSFWYTLVNRWRETGLITTYEYDRLPAFDAYKFGRLELGAASSGKDVSEGQIRIYEINAPRGRVWVMWSKDGQNHSYPFNSTTPYKAFDVYGNSLSVGNSINIGLMPVYLEWDAPTP
jgi:hypothetical protein